MDNIGFRFNNFSLYYDKIPALQNINLTIPLHKLTSLIGPSGCGKSSFLRSLNRMHDFTRGVHFEGELLWYDKKNILNINDVETFRRKVGMVFQRANVFPMSIFDNVAYGLKLNLDFDKKNTKDIVFDSLKSVGLFDEVKGRLDESALKLSGGQAQRLCIARMIAISPEIILMDEPTSALDPVSTGVIEKLILKLKEQYTVIIVTHSMSQARRLSDDVIFFYLGEVIESGTAKKIFESPEKKITKEYITGSFG